MTIAVEPMTSDLMEVTLTPSWWRRLFLRERTVMLFIERTPLFGWVNDKTRRPIDDRRIEAALDLARFDAQRVSRASSGVAPPG